MFDFAIMLQWSFFKLSSWSRALWLHDDENGPVDNQTLMFSSLLFSVASSKTTKFSSLLWALKPQFSVSLLQVLKSPLINDNNQVVSESRRKLKEDLQGIITCFSVS